MGELNAEPSSSRWTLDSTLSGGKQPLIQDACFEETRYASRSFPNADTEVSASETQKRRIGSGPGWQPPSEMAGSTLPWIGGGAQGGVPDRSGPRAKDLTALGADLWSTLGKTVSSTSSGGSIPANMPQNGTHPSSSSSNASTFVVDDPGKYDLTSASFVCRALSECEPCPASTRNHPFCRPYGNRRLVSCEVLREPSAPGPSGASSSKPQPPSDAEFVGWEACGKVVRNETRDYLEFVVSWRHKIVCHQHATSD